MSDPFSIVYYDRKSERLMNESVYGAGFLYWSYNNRLGRLATDLIFRQKWSSQIYGWFHKQAVSRWKIKRFVKNMKVSLDESVRPIGDFKCFNDFFIREIDLSKRSVNLDPLVCIAPVDGKVLAFTGVEPETTFRIKRSLFNLRKFLCNDSLTKRFTNGSMVVCRLCLTDYHHFHFPTSGIPGPAVAIQGKYYAGGPYGVRRLVPFYTQNYRMVTPFESDHFGQMAMIEIGAFTVGSIQQKYQPGVAVGKGFRKGYFELGGSTVVLLFQEDMIKLDEDLLAHSQNGIETYVHLGESIGRALQSCFQANGG
jgi:phosphatidylserine decarboxylase